MEGLDESLYAFFNAAFICIVGATVIFILVLFKQRKLRVTEFTVETLEGEPVNVIYR